MTLTEQSQQPAHTIKQDEGTTGSSGDQTRAPDTESPVRTTRRDRNFRSVSRDQQKELEADNDLALELVTRAASTIDILQSRCHQLEANANDLRERLKTETETAERVIKDWERLATAMKTQLQDCETRISGLQQRLEAAEARAEAGETRAEAAEQQATIGEEIASSFREKIISAFGSGSQAQAAMEAVVNT